ncbi:MAG: hypothetical protein IKP65_05530 [Alphaproteobacteria bacterium]|nr:hypothetical protein [Alphaproteobacteria bacterium]
MNIKDIAYIENKIAYFDEEKLCPCGCGGKAIANFYLISDKQTPSGIEQDDFCDVIIKCSKCGMNTGICDTAEEAIVKWFNAFSKKNDIDHEDDYTLGTSLGFNRE